MQNCLFFIFMPFCKLLPNLSACHIPPQAPLYFQLLFPLFVLQWSKLYVITSCLHVRFIWKVCSCTWWGNWSLTTEFESSKVRPRPPGNVPSLSFSLLFEFICKFPGLMLASREKVSGSPFALPSVLTLHLSLLPSVFQLSILYLKCTKDVATLELDLFLK